MDGRTKTAKISQILEPIVNQEVHVNRLWRRIMLEIGGSDSVIRETFRIMIRLGLIYECEPFVYKVVSSKPNI